MKNLLLLFWISVLVTFANTNNNQIRYDNYVVYTVKINNLEQYHTLKKLENDPDNFSIWCSSFNRFNSDIEIMVNPNKIIKFLNLVEKINSRATIKIKNVQRLIDQEQDELMLKPRSFSWENYYNLQEINTWLTFITELNPHIITPFIVGKSYEGRDIRGIKISYKSGNPGVFIESNIHAREWITSATVTYFINELINSNRSEIRNIAENVDWYIIPNINPDGFVYSHEKDRMWRKTRQPNSGSKCIGVDGNRNFDSHWLENGGASKNPCSETYAGPKPFSEPETKALADYYKSIKSKISIYLSIHSYGQLLLSPYGHTGNEFPENYNDMQTIAKATTSAIEKKFNTTYRYGSTASVLYVASGVSPDWAYNTQGTRLTYTIELRDRGQFGFILPREQITPTAQETTDGLVAMINAARKLRYL